MTHPAVQRLFPLERDRQLADSFLRSAQHRGRTAAEAVALVEEFVGCAFLSCERLLRRAFANRRSATTFPFAIAPEAARPLP